MFTYSCDKDMYFTLVYAYILTIFYKLQLKKQHVYNNKQEKKRFMHKINMTENAQPITKCFDCLIKFFYNYNASLLLLFNASR